MRRIRLALAVALAASASANTSVMAATATGTLGVTLTIAATCTVAGGTVAFGSQGVLAANVNQTGTITVACTNSTIYTIGLDQGTNGASVTARKMRSPTTLATVDYSLYSDSGYTANWGNTSGSWVSGAGNGTSQSITVYGRIPAQTTPAPAADYSDSVTITVTY